MTPDLKDHPFFKGLKPEYLDLIAGYTAYDSFKPGEYIFKEGDAAAKFYIVSTGKVNVEVRVPDSHPFAIQTLKDGDILGWSWFIAPNQWRFSAHAIEKTELIVINGKALKDACEKNHDLGYEIYKRLADVFVQRLEATRHQLLEMYTHR
ncbi:MAG: cyclic nucleotide-binding domain-containing protein [Candidatus Omnitrophota bacterium]